MDDELSLKDTLYNILHGLQSEKNWRETGEGIQRLRDIGPNVVESLGRGGIAQAIGTSGDLRDLRNTINSYLPKSVSNFTKAAEFLANPYATAIQETAPTTESTKEFVPRVTATYPGYEQHETLGEYIAPSLAYFGGKGVQAIKATKDLPIGASIIGPESKLWKDVTNGASLEQEAFKASRMEAKGKTPEEIFKETGMVRGLDNQWRSEITDFWSTVKGDKPFGELYAEKKAINPDVRVKDILEHPELFRHYPELGEYKIGPHGVKEPYKGSFYEKEKAVSLREDLTPEEIRSVLHHELTHGVQGIENWNRGGSVSAMDTWSKIEANKRMAAINKELDGVWAEIRARRQAGLPDDDLQIRKNELIKQNNEAFDFGMQDPYNLYERLGGEAEARMVQARLGLTQDQLRQHFPYEQSKTGLDINPDEAIVAGYEPGVINTPSLNQPKASVEPPISKKDELGFNSSLENAIFGIKQPKGTGDQFLKQLEKTPGVKAEELEVTGLKKYLQDNKFVTKQEVQDFIEKNRVKLENKYLYEGAGEGNTYDDYRLDGGEVYDDDEYINSLAGDLHYDMKNDPDIFIQEKEELLKRYPDLYEGHDTNPYMEARLNQDVEDALWETAKSQASDMYYENPIRHYYDEHGYDIYGNDDVGYSIKDPNGRFLDLTGGRGLYDISDVEQELRSHLLDEGVLSTDEEGAAKYADYVLPGKHENYREVLVTLPQKEPNLISKITFKNDAAVDDFLTDMSIEGYENLDYGRVNDSRTVEFKGAIPSNIEQLIRQNNGSITVGREQAGKAYQSGHFDEPNILAHMRVDDRIIDGKKTLMVEEIQSDWHQEGRKRGYTQPISDERKMELRLELDKIERAKKELLESRSKQVDDEEAYNSINGILLDLERQRASLADELRGTKGVPDAPHKKTWHEMMVKQALDMAVKGDYDAIAFTTGKSQAERYNLARHVDSLNLIPALTDKDYILQGWKNGESVVRREVNKDELADYVGKEVAEKLLASDIGHGVKEVKGDDLAVGGQGMKGFYDKILPDYINKYTKKWGMGMKKANAPGERNLGVPTIHRAYTEAGYTKEEFDALPQDKRIEIIESVQPKEPVHFVELTDAAKKDIKEKGQPLFAGIGLMAGADYMTGLDEQNKTGIFKDLMKSKKH